VSDSDCRRLVILLTATIAPGPVPFLMRSDPSMRRSDYAGALTQWVAVRQPPSIVFCDNSAAAVDDLRGLAGGQVEFLSFRGNEGAQTRGKGFGEIGIIAHALEHSATVANADLVLKVTGRLFVRNAEALIARLTREKGDVFCDLRQNLEVSDSRVFCATPAFLARYLVPSAEEIDDHVGRSFEVVLARAVHRAIGDGCGWGLLPMAPDLVGIAATADQPYPSSRFGHSKRALFRWLKQRVLSR
jgi:hypothetical protein